MSEICQREQLMDHNVKQEYKNMGFPEDMIQEGIRIAQKQNLELIDVLFKLRDKRQQHNKYHIGQMENQEKDGNGNQQFIQQQDYEDEEDYINVEDQIRKVDTPVGLKNIGNTCYFNSLIQSYFYNPLFLERVMKFQRPLNLDLNKICQNQSQKNRIIGSINLVAELQKLFAFMIFSQKKYADPKQVLNNIVDDKGNKINIGEQEDIGEFNLNFLERVEEGLQYCDTSFQSGVQQIQSPQKSNDLDLLSEIDFTQNSKKKNTQISLDLTNGFQNSVVQMENKREFQLSSGKKMKICIGNDQLVSSLFYGQRKEFIIYDQNQNQQQNESTHAFAPIILDLQYQDLYSSWEAYNNFNLEGFKINDKEFINAKKEIWMTQVPKNLMFQIQRVQYDQENGSAKKVNEKFYFDKEIYIDRFLLKNRDYISQSKLKLNTLKEKKIQIQEELNRLQNFNNDKLSVTKIFQNVLDFMAQEKVGWKIYNEKIGINDESQQQKLFKVQENNNEQKTPNLNQQKKQEDLDDIESLFNSVLTQSSNSSTQQNILSEKKQSVQNKEQFLDQIQYTKDEKLVIQTLNQYIGKTNTNIDNLKIQLSEIDKQIDQIYDKLKEQKYILHTILVHSGESDQGHYYAYIYLRDQKKWFRYNDTIIKEEKEEDVLEIAYGKGNQSAYCIMYLNESLINHPLKYDFQLLTNIQKRQFNKQLTYSLVSQQLKETIEQENQRLQSKMKLQTLSQQCEEIIQNYSDRFEFINQYVRRKKQKSKIILLNISAYLKHKFEQNPENNDIYKIFKWSLLEASLQDTLKINMFELKSQKFISEKLQELFKNMSEYKSPTKILLSNQDFEQFDKAKSDYLSEIQCIVALTYSIDQVAQQNWINCLYGLQRIFNLKPDQTNYFNILSKDVLRVVLLKIGCDLFTLNKDVTQIFNICDYALVYVKLLPKNDQTLKQLSIIMKEFLDLKGRRIFEQNQINTLSQKINGINEPSYKKDILQYFNQDPQELNEMISLIVSEYQQKIWKIQDNQDLMETQINDKMLQLKYLLQDIIQFHKTLKEQNSNNLLNLEQRINKGYQKSYY